MKRVQRCKDNVEMEDGKLSSCKVGLECRYSHVIARRAWIRKLGPGISGYLPQRYMNLMSEVT